MKNYQFEINYTIRLSYSIFHPYLDCSAGSFVGCEGETDPLDTALAYGSAAGNVVAGQDQAYVVGRLSLACHYLSNIANRHQN